MRFAALVCVLVSIALVSAVVDPPVLLWSYGGSCGYSCQYGWYSSPAVATDPVSGETLVVSAAYDVYALYGSNGSTRWYQTSPGGGRVWPGIVIADLDKDSKLEVVVANGVGYVTAYNLTDGAIYYPNFPYQFSGVTQEFRSISVADINQDGGLEIVLGRANADNTNTYALTYYGSPLSGFPQGGDQTKGYTWGVYNSNIGIADMDGNGDYEIIVPSDVHYVCAYHHDGSAVGVDTNKFGTNRPYWGLVGYYINQTYEDQGYGPCGGVDSTIRTNFANGPVVIGDVDNDGIKEYIVVGNTYKCDSAYTSVFNGVHINNADRTRWKTATYDWSTVPNPATGPPTIVGQYNVIEDNQNNPALGDLDGDGKLEIIYPSFDGKMHAYWLDKTEKHFWPLDVKAATGSSSQYMFASEPAIVDIDNDGKAEVIFGTWTASGSNDWGYLCVADYQGNLLYKVQVPQPQICISNPSKCETYNGIMSCPTVANIDSDPNYEVVVMSIFSGTLAFRLPNSTNAQIQWGTSRGNFQRTAQNVVPNVTAVTPPPPQRNASPASAISAVWVSFLTTLMNIL